MRRVLPTGVLHNLVAVSGGDLAALARAGAIVAGLAFTTTGFLKIRWTRPAGPPHKVGSTLRNTHADAGAAPVLPLVIDINTPLAAIDARRAGQPPYARALCLLTRDGQPVTKVRLDLPEPVLAADQIDAQLRALLGQEVSQQPVPSAARLPADLAGRAVTVVVATRDRPELLAECIESVFAGRVVPDRLIVVDNAPSTDATAHAGGPAGPHRATAGLRPRGPDRVWLERTTRPCRMCAPNWSPSPTTTSWSTRDGWNGWSSVRQRRPGRLRHRTDRPPGAGHAPAAVGRRQLRLRQGPAAPHLRQRRAPPGRPALSAHRRGLSAPEPTWPSAPPTCEHDGGFDAPWAPARRPWVAMTWPRSTT